MTLQRLVLTYTREGVEARVLYRTTSGAGPGTKARQREVAELTRSGLERALEALEGRVEDLGTSGFTTREDTVFLWNLGAPGVHKKRAPTTKGDA